MSSISPAGALGKLIGLGPVLCPATIRGSRRPPIKITGRNPQSGVRTLHNPPPWIVVWQRKCSASRGGRRRLSYAIEFIAGPLCVSLGAPRSSPQGDRGSRRSFFNRRTGDRSPISRRISNPRPAFEGQLVNSAPVTVTRTRRDAGFRTSFGSLSTIKAYKLHALRSCLSCRGSRRTDQCRHVSVARRWQWPESNDRIWTRRVKHLSQQL